jgi:hypothetical protein
VGDVHVSVAHKMYGLVIIVLSAVYRICFCRVACSAASGAKCQEAYWSFYLLYKRFVVLVQIDLLLEYT